MYLAELRFTLIADTEFSLAEQAIRRYLEALIFNGQMLGREFPTAFTGDAFCSRLVLPTADALSGQHASARVKAAEQQLAAAGLGYPQCQLLGQDLMSQQTVTELPAELVLFTTYADTCSPLRCSCSTSSAICAALRCTTCLPLCAQSSALRADSAAWAA